MIYFDNAATTCPKPPEVVRAVEAALGSFGAAGRGAHDAALSADEAVFEARSAVARLFNAPSPARVAFTCNATEALNIAIAGLLGPGQRAVTTAASHNSMLRPLYRARAAGAEVAVAPVRPDGSLEYDRLAELLRPGARLVAVTHASNLTGDVYDLARIAALAHESGALVVADVAQTAGAVPVDQGAAGLDVVAFTGHKGLFGPQGTGGLCVAEGLDLPPFKVGGSGVRSFDEEHVPFMPESLEAGTLNAHGIAGLAAGVAFVERTGVEAIGAHDAALVRRFEDGVRGIRGVRLLGGQGDAGRTGIVALNVDGLDAGEVSARLNADYGICTRSGAHCAPLMHEALGTASQGAVRFSFSYFNTPEEIDGGVRALAEIAAEAQAGREGGPFRTLPHPRGGAGPSAGPMPRARIPARS